jgi:hypothetical protein
VLNWKVHQDNVEFRTVTYWLWDTAMNWIARNTIEDADGAPASVIRAMCEWGLTTFDIKKIDETCSRSRQY